MHRSNRLKSSASVLMDAANHQKKKERVSQDVIDDHRLPLL